MAVENLFKGTPSRDPTVVAADDEEQEQRLESLPYYHRRLNRADTFNVLHQPGEFLLRRTASSGRPAVSVFWDNHIMHFPVRKLEEGYCFESKTFPTIEELIAWHRTHYVPLTKETGAILKVPKPLAAWELLTNEVIAIRKVYQGSFGDVYVGNVVLRGDQSVRPVAIKAASDNGTEAETTREALLREARALRDLNDHPNVVKCYGFTVDSLDGRILAAVELIGGGTLMERLRSTPPLTPQQKYHLVIAASKAILHVHCHGYVHREINSKNFLIAQNAQGDVVFLKLSGFHFAQRLDSTDLYRARSADRMPAPVYSSVESLAAYIWTKGSDIWSWAVLVWEIYCNGTRPFHDEIPDNVATNANVVLRTLQGGVRLRPHADMSEAVLGLWKAAFDLEPTKRPSAYKIARQLLDSPFPVS